MIRTFHVFRSDGAWVVQKEGKKNAGVFLTQRNAVQAARQIVKETTSGQLVIHGTDGRIRNHESYGMTRILDPPKKSRLAKRIGRAVGKVALERLQPVSLPSRAHSTKK